MNTPLLKKKKKNAHTHTHTHTHTLFSLHIPSGFLALQHHPITLLSSFESLRSQPSLCPSQPVEVEVTLWLTVSRPDSLSVRRPFGTRNQFFFLLEISFRQLRLCYFVVPSLTRGRVCNLLVQLLLGLARAVTLESKSCRTHSHILLSHLRLP
jgi:hypothetical protein